MRHVIIGNGPAGVIAAETIRAQDKEASITIIGDEGEPPYARMAIPYLLTGMISEEGTYLRKQDNHFGDKNIDLVHGRVSQVNTANKTLAVGGSSLPFDRLLIATGSRAIQPNLPGMDLDGVVNCWTLADARAITDRTQEGSNVVLIGAGFIGCIVLEALAARGVNLTVIEGLDRMVPRMMDQVSGGMIADWCKTKGVDVHLSTLVESIVTNDDQQNPLLVTTNQGDQIPARMVVCAAGVTANIDFLDGSGISTGDGVLVDDHMQTNIEGIFAAGDVAEGIDFSTGTRGVHAIQPTASDHGRIAGLNMVGKTTSYHGSLNMNVLDTVGLVSASFGLWDGGPSNDTVTVSDSTKYLYLKLAFEEDRLVGGITIGRTDYVGVIRGLIQNKTKLGPWKQKLHENPHKIMDAYVALSQGHNPLVGV